MFFKQESTKRTYPFKETSVILKRQIPIRFNEEPQSWFGGLPKMSRLKKWPRDRDGAPLHFIAQIACADLPPAMWNHKGPRKGWLLLFVEVLKLDDEDEGSIVRVIHVNSLGPEREPPEDMAIVRHTMSNGINYTSDCYPGIPKLWRKWPIDIVTQTFEVLDELDANNGAPSVKAEDLYEQPLNDKFIDTKTLGLDSPLTWRGALYFVERLKHDLTPKEFIRSFRGNGGLLDAPEFDLQRYQEIYHDRLSKASGRPVMHVLYSPEYEALRISVEAEIQAERRSGWVARTYEIVEAETTKFRAIKEKLKVARDLGETELQIGNVIYNMQDSSFENIDWNIKRHENKRKALEDLLANYPSPDPEASLTTEIRKAGEAYLDWGREYAVLVQAAFNRILCNNLDDMISERDWMEIINSFPKQSASYWSKTLSSDGAMIKQKTKELHFKNHLDMAVREDVLDLYTRSPQTQAVLPEGVLKIVETAVKSLSFNMPHRMGALPSHIQDHSLHDDSNYLLFQIASDKTMGWMWGDAGGLYVMLDENALAQRRFKRTQAWIEGH